MVGQVYKGQILSKNTEMFGLHQSGEASLLSHPPTEGLRTVAANQSCASNRLLASPTYCHMMTDSGDHRQGPRL